MDIEYLAPAAIAEYISYGQCARYAKHRIQDIERTKRHAQTEFHEAFTPLNILLSVAGDEFEQQITNRADRYTRVTDDLETPDDAPFDHNHESLSHRIRTAVEADTDWGDAPTMLIQTSLVGDIKDHPIRGDADNIFVWSTEEGAEVRIIDIKRTNDERVYHQIQAAAYAALVDQLIRQTSAISATAVTISGGVITQETPVTPLTRDQLPQFDVEPRIADISRLLSDGSPLMSALNTPTGKVTFQLDSKCDTCPYNEGCVTESFEDGHIRLLGLTEAQQEQLLEQNIETIADVAALCRTPSEDAWTPTTYEDGRFKTDTYRELAQAPGIGELFPQLIYRAESMLDALQTDPDGISDRPRNWLPGSGHCKLPDDDPADEVPGDHEWKAGTMVRVYLNVQHDHLRNRLMQVSARVTATASEAEPQHASVLSDGAQEGESAADQEEAALLEQVWTELCTAIRAVAEGIDLSDVEQEYPPLHFYLYTDGEHNSLVEAFDRHPDTEAVNAFRSTLEGMQQSGDGMVSTLRSEIESHIILETPSPGLLHAYRELYPPADAYNKPRSRDAWTYSPPDSERSYDLRRVFGRRLFNLGVAANLPPTQPPESGPTSPRQAATDSTGQQAGIGLQLDPETPDQFEGINSRMRYGASVPLAYLWAAVDRIDEDWETTDAIDSSALAEFELNTYRYRDADKQREEITPADLETLGRHLCDVIEHIERALTYRDSLFEKAPFPMNELTKATFEPPSLAVGAEQYLIEEYRASREETYELYRRFPIQRILSGESIPVYVTEVEKINRSTLRVEGRLRYDDQTLFGDAGEQIKRACRKKGSQGTSSGSWMVANPFVPGHTGTEVTQPYKIEQGVNATIEQLDLDSDKIGLTLRNFWHEGGTFGQPHAKWTRDPDRAQDENRLHIDTGEWLILDPQTDDITAERAQRALEYADTNALHQRIEAVRHGQEHQPETLLFEATSAATSDTPAVEAVANWLARTYGPETYPNDAQRQFITEARRQFVALQGPPGTGKTAGTMAPALLARLYAGACNGVSVNGLVTAPSNTAIDELLADTTELLDAAEEDGPIGTAELDIELVRIGEQPPDPIEHVTYVDYNNDDHAGRIDRVLDRLRATGTVPRQLNRKTEHSPPTEEEEQSGLSAFVNEDHDDSETPVTAVTEQPLTLVFATSTRAWRFLKEAAPGSSPDDEEMAAQELWHVLAVDEASMLELPNFLLAGSAFRAAGQVLVGGDHRQLPPVQKHDWDEVRRRDIRATAAYLSTLDYMRLLGGETVLDDDHAAWYICGRDPDTIDIPTMALDTTYRFDEWTAKFLRQAVYEEDDIPYSSGRDKLESVESVYDEPAEPLMPLFDPATTVALITYGQGGEAGTYQQWNPIESALTEALIMATDSDAEIGVVTPHNAQRGRIQSMLQATGYTVNQARSSEDTIKTDSSIQDIQVETVNRFQGGERELMVVNATVSDPNYIAAEDEFLLQENRINVSFSRHRERLIVIAPNTLLGYLPEDPDLYEHARLWKDLAATLGETPTSTSDPAWEGELGDVLASVGKSSVPEMVRQELTTTITIYTNAENETNE